MLRWSDELRIGLCADRVIWVRIARGVGRRVVEKRVVETKADIAQPAWQAALEALRATIDAQSGRANAYVVLSNRFVRYAAVPWHDQLMRQEERLIQARQCFRQIYGDVASRWSIGMSEARYRKPALASAVDQELIDAIRGTFKAGIRLVSISPYLTAAYGHFRSAIKATGNGPMSFSVVEPDSIGALFFDGSGLRGVFNQRLREDWPRALGNMQMQSVGEAESPAMTFVWAPEHAPTESAQGAGFTPLALRAVHGFSPISDKQLSMALAGL